MKTKKRRKRIGKIDRPFLFLLFCLIGMGLVMVFSASMYSVAESGQSGVSQFYKQALFSLAGIAIMLFLSKIDYKIFLNKSIYLTLFGITFILLLLVYAPGVGVEVNGAHRWVNLGFRFQPSEIMKMVGIIYIAATLVNKPKIMKTNFGNNLPTKQLWGWCYLPIIAVCLVIVKEPSLSATMVVALGMLCVLWYSGIPINQLLPFGLIIAGGLVFFLFEDWRMTRILSMLGQSTANYQISQSLVAFGSGGFFGTGLGNGKQKLLFLPEIQNDFIFANIGEEFGLIGCLVVLTFYVLLIYRGFQIGTHCKDRFGFLYTLSIMTVLSFQVLVNVAVATSLLPVTGMALPFISYGGTSVIILLTTIGPILNISRSVKLPRRKRFRFRKYENIHRSRRNRRTYLSGDSNSRTAEENI